MTARSQIVSVSMQGDLLERFDAWVAAKKFPTRSSGLQSLIREQLDEAALSDGDTPCVATVSFVYDHHRRELMEKLAHVQHEHLDLVVATTHVHLDHDRCLEVLVLRGPARAVRALGDRLVAIRGVERGDVFLSAAAPAHGHHAHDHAHEGAGWHAEAHAPGHAKKKARPRRRKR